MLCRNLAEVIAAGQQHALDDPPLTQEQADQVAAILAHRQAPQPATSP